MRSTGSNNAELCRAQQVTDVSERKRHFHPKRGRRRESRAICWLGALAIFLTLSFVAGAEDVTNTNSCSLRDYLNFIDEFLSKAQIDAKEFNIDFRKLTPACEVDLNEAEQLSRRSRFFVEIFQNGPVRVFVFRTLEHGQYFTAQFSVNLQTRRIENPTGYHKSL
jgi:hypothetical protein